MRKILFTLALALILALALVEAASADGGPHGGYTATTDACAGCHRAHTATGPNLLVASSTYALCMTCHGASGSGANTNVDDGLYMAVSAGRNDPYDGDNITADDANLLGGGFVNYKGSAVTSSHDASGASGKAAWGNGVNRGVAADITDTQFNCASCHDPHGSPNYRIINASVNGAGVAVAQVDEGAASKDYGTEQWGAGQSDVCAACHGAYHVTSAGSGSDAALVATGGYAHRTDMSYAYGANNNPETVGMSGYTLPLAGTTVVCQTCHLPHGSSSAMSGFADGGPTGLGTVPGNTTSTDSALLRLDNRGVCEVCHQK